MAAYDTSLLASFGRHTPRILRRQLIHQLVEQYSNSFPTSNNNNTQSFINECRPSIQRFHGALLFVDISGFTALSLRLSVEELKNHINDYFTKMLDIVDKHGGDVIKFAGDALFIVWETGAQPKSANSSQVSSWTDSDDILSKNNSKNNSFTKEFELLSPRIKNNKRKSNNSPAPGIKRNSSNDSINSRSKLTSPGSPKARKSLGLRINTENTFGLACKIALGKAVECGRDISAVCGNHKVVLTQKIASGDKSAMQKGANMFRMLLPSLGGMLSPTRAGAAEFTPATFPTVVEEEDTVAYLNVHSGVSMGLMAGIDIGANDRWEYFLIGDPLSEVATAEGLASTGDVVISPEAHSMLHAYNVLTSPQSVPKVSGRVAGLSSLTFPTSPAHGQVSPTLSCGCERLAGGFCKLAAKITPVASKRKSRAKAKMDDSMSMDESFSKDGAILDSIGQDVSEAFATHGFVFRAEIKKQIAAREATKRLENCDDGSTSGESAGSSDRVPPRELLGLNEESIRRHFSKWAHSCLTDDLARHVHDVARDDYVFKEINRLEPLKKEVMLQMSRAPVARSENRDKTNLQYSSSAPSLALPDLGENSLTPPPGAQTSSAPMTRQMTVHKLSRDGRSPTVLTLMPLKRRASSKRMTENQDGTSLMAEIRYVTVMFVKIDMPNMELLVDANRSLLKSSGDEEKFLTKTVNEKYADDLLLGRLQTCMEALTTAFSNNGGQMRQFIVDDKGTVCIGTFGLRGSVSDDNAAAAIETAKAIVDKLQSIGIDSSIGVTVGKAFCGLVGSNKRHEYAVMGPSTNLSARLMCKAPPCGILCDIETKNRDRSHTFQTLTHIVAKGYRHPVGTFMPEFKSVEAFGNGFLSSKVFSASFDVGDSPHFLRRDSTNSAMSFARQSSKTILGMDRGSRLLRQLLKVDYHLKSPLQSAKAPNLLRNIKQFAPNTKLQLRGRREEMENILMFLFESLVIHNDPIVPPHQSPAQKPAPKKMRELAGKVVEAVKSLLLLTERARFISIASAQGMGKTALVTAVTQQIFAVASKDQHVNIHLFKTRFNSFQVNQPFNSWKPIIREMLTRISKEVTLNPHASTKTRRKSMVVASTANNRDLIHGAEYITSKLPLSLQALMPLLGELSILPEDKLAVEALELREDSKTLKTAQLLAGIIQAYGIFTKKLIFFTVEDIHTFDTASLAVLQQMWIRNTGVVVVFTARTSTLKNAKLSQSTKSIERCSFPDNGSTDILSSFSEIFESDPDRFLDVELERLDATATAELTRDTLHSLGIMSVDHELVEQVCEISGGCPMYAFELAKSIADQEQGPCSAQRLNEVVANFRCNRIEEVICHRFDQLNTTAQTVLKMAAVACSNGAPFNFDLLLFIFANDTDEIVEPFDAATSSFNMSSFRGLKSDISSRSLNDDSSIASALIDVLQSGDFIKIVSDGTALPLINRDSIVSGAYIFEFNIALEQRTIYDLLLDDQKQVIHECVAEFYQSLAEDQARVSDVDPIAQAETHWEESFHWQHAAVWPAALKSAYQATQLHTDKQKQYDYLQTAHHIYTTLVHVTNETSKDSPKEEPSEEASVTSQKETFTHAVLTELFDSAFETAVTKPPSPTPSNTPVLTDHSHLISLERVNQIFGGDSELLEIGLQIHIRMAHKNMSLLEDTAATQTLLEDALQILFHTRIPFLLSSSRLANMMNSFQSMSHIYTEDGDDEDTVLKREDYFCIKDFNSVCYSLFSMYVQNFLTSTRSTEESKLKAMFVASKFFELTRAEGTDTLHHLQALLLVVQMSHKVGQVREAAVLVDELLLGRYDESVHSAQLIKIYGADAMPVVLSLMSQTLFQFGKWQIATQFIDSAVALTLRWQHSPSVSLAVMRIVSVLTFLRRHEEALSLFTHHLVLKETENVIHGQTMDDVNSVCLEWLSRLVKYQTFRNTGDATVFQDDSAEVDSILLRGGVTQSGGDESGLIYDHLYIQGRGLESIFADMCAMKIEVLCHQQNSGDTTDPAAVTALQSYCSSAVGFVKHSLAVTCDTPHRIAFHSLNTVISLSQIVQIVLTSKNSVTRLSSLFRQEFSASTPQLNHLKALSITHKHHFASLMLTLLHKQLSNSLENEMTLAETVEQLRRVNGGSVGYHAMRRLVSDLLPEALPK